MGKASRTGVHRDGSSTTIAIVEPGPAVSSRARRFHRRVESTIEAPLDNHQAPRRSGQITSDASTAKAAGRPSLNVELRSPRKLQLQGLADGASSLLLHIALSIENKQYSRSVRLSGTLRPETKSSVYIALLDVVPRPMQDGLGHASAEPTLLKRQVEVIIVDRSRSLTMLSSCSGRVGLCATVLTIFAAYATAAYPAESREFKVGFAERDISPAIGMEQPGGYGKAYHRAFHDPCKVRAAVFDDGKTRVAIVGIDALFIRRQTVQAVREAISKKCGIKPESILISASHTHSGGPIGYFLPGEFDDASPLVRSLVHERTVCANPDYLAKVERGIVDAVCTADARRTPRVAVSPRAAKTRSRSIADFG